MSDKKEFYRLLKIAGLVSFIPIVLLVGVMTGYYIGELLSKKTHPWVLPVSIILGALVSAFEVGRIIHLVLRIDKEN
jgi:F0F1-type ATP synthase assembly protein I